LEFSLLFFYGLDVFVVVLLCLVEQGFGFAFLDAFEFVAELEDSCTVFEFFFEFFDFLSIRGPQLLNLDLRLLQRLIRYIPYNPLLSNRRCIILNLRLHVRDHRNLMANQAFLLVYPPL
jgi:hypothetical protein